MRALVLGSTGYTGMMLVRLLLEHPHITNLIPVSTSSAGREVRSVDPGLAGSLGKMEATDGTYLPPDKIDPRETDIIFSALPHKASAGVIGPLLGKRPVIDLSADFRFRDALEYEKTYGPHPHPELLDGAVYGLTEWYRDQIRKADIIACPGCYPTCTLLPLLPLAGELEGTIVVNALTGISGAGRKERENLLFNERSENVAAYSPGTTHRHVPEILQELRSAGLDHDLVFTPHLVPMKQGMLVTTVVKSSRLDAGEIRDAIGSAYRNSPFVGISARGLPETRDVRNTNRCDIAVTDAGEQILLISVIDNLYKGAAGQAVQNMNVRLGFPEAAGLRTHGEF